MTSVQMKKLLQTFCIVALGAGIAGCGVQGEAIGPNTSGDIEITPDTDFSKRRTAFGEGGFSLLGNDKKSEGPGQGGGGGGLGVNSFLWRASLDTISFMPVSQADPFGGVILTDWHSTTGSPDERFKLNVYILGRALRADGVRVAIFSQVKDPKDGWKDSAVPNETGTKIEDAILTRARQLRRQQIQSQEQQ